MAVEMRPGTPDTEKVANWWSDEAPSVAGIQWIEVPRVSRNVNMRATGDPGLGWVEHSARFMERFPRPRRALSLSCGFGVIERDLRARDICQEVHGLDVAPGAIEGAIKLARENKLDGLTYAVADLNNAELPAERYHAVYAHAAFHHVFNLEHLLDQLRKTLVPGGIVVVFDYVGPSQMQFPHAHLEIADAFLRAIPARFRRFRRWQGIKEEALRLTLKSMNESDPSEGIRAQEIVPLLMSRFDVHYLKAVGGTLSMLVLNEIAGNLPSDDPEVNAILDAMLVTENVLIDEAALPSYHVYGVFEKTNNELCSQRQWQSLRELKYFR